MELKGKEKAKIEYARKHFSYLSTKANDLIKYEVVRDFEDLMNKI
jgi:restriction endonuclease